MKKRLFAILLTLCLLAQLFPLTASAVRLDWPHPSAHCVCGGGISNHQAMNGHTAYEGVYFTKDGKENTSGDISKMNVIRSEADLLEINHKAANNKGKTFYYYLANDVTLTKRIHAWEGCTFVICLHGHTLTCNVPGAQSAFLVMNNARLVFTDCQLSGDRGLITGDSCAAVSLDETATFELYGVSICMTSSETDGIRDIYNDPVCGIYNCGTFNMYGGCYYQKSSDYPTDRPVISNIRNTKYGPGVINRGTFNMYDGIISGNERNGVMSTITRSDDTINLYGGTITGNTGAGISATHWPMPSIATSDYYTNVNLYGGTISENTGAGIDAAYGRVTMAQQSSAIPRRNQEQQGRRDLTDAGRLDRQPRHRPDYRQLRRQGRGRTECRLPDPYRRREDHRKLRRKSLSCQWKNRHARQARQRCADRRYYGGHGGSRGVRRGQRHGLRQPLYPGQCGLQHRL